MGDNTSAKLSQKPNSSPLGEFRDDHNRGKTDVKFVVAQVERCVDGLERLKVNVDLAFLALGGDDFTTVYDEAIWRDFGV